MLFIPFILLSVAASISMSRAQPRMFSVRSDGSADIQKVHLPPLPYAYDALEPHIGEQTLRIHHDKHHAKYVDTTNSMIEGTNMEGMDVVQILRKSYGTNQGLFNNAAQSFNHAFYWQCMKPNGGGAPTGQLADLINSSFGSFENFRKEFATAGATVFGSGWAWLIWTPSGLKVTKTTGADCPLTEPETVPLLTMDVWEHAYYLNYQNMRPTYIDTFLNHLVNWDFVASQLP
mmetsp:Transcript_7893/g.11766  ORF Transcript_7893/g.11766 Transcript_7893/m.11766 type:complete len:232 (-) Transcript_7893:162-857(-)